MGSASASWPPVCRGQGVVEKSELISVRIPAGVDTGSKVRIPGRGNVGRDGGPPGELFISIAAEAHPFFRRDGANISIKVPITV
ncbi:MAG: DnaJ C-terminal domain-containing protein, partial [Desulfomonilia bacterium]